MDAITHAHLEFPAQLFKALSHSSRLCMVEELLRGEKSVLGLTRLIGTDMSTVSKHLALLRNAGVVTSERRGNQVFYALRRGEVFRFVRGVPALTKRLAAERETTLVESRQDELYPRRSIGTAHGRSPQ